MRDYTPTIADAELEADINVQMMIVMEDRLFTRTERVAAFERAAKLHLQRTPEMVLHLERMRGISVL